MTQYPSVGLFRPVADGAFAATNATLTGDVTLGEDVGVWFGCVVRGDDAPLSIGRRTNVQDLTMIHADTGVPNVIGEEVTIGHRVVLHGSRVGDRCLIGMGSVLLSGSVIGEASALSGLGDAHYLRGNILFSRGGAQACLREHGLGLEAARRAGDARAEARADSLRLPAAAKKKLTIQRLPNPPRVEIRSTYTETVHIPWYGDKVLTFTPFAEAPL